MTNRAPELKNKIFPTTAQPMSDRPTTPRDGTNDRTSSPIPQIPPIETLDRTRWGRQSSTTLNNPPSGSNDDDNDKTKNASIDVSELPNSQRPSAWNQLDGAASSNPFRRPDTPLPLPGGIMRPSNPTHASTSGGPSMPLPTPGDTIRRPYDPTQYIDALEMQDLPLSPRTAEDFPKTPRNTPCAHPDAGEPLTQTESQKSVTFKQNPVDEIRERTPTPESQRTLKTHEKMALIAPGVPASTIAGPSTATTEQTGARDYSTKTEGAEFKKAVSGSQSDTQGMVCPSCPHVAAPG